MHHLPISVCSQSAQLHMIQQVTSEPLTENGRESEVDHTGHVIAKRQLDGAQQSVTECKSFPKSICRSVHLSKMDVKRGITVIFSETKQP